MEETDLVHYEVFVRKSPDSRWVLELAIEKIHVALATAEDLVKAGQVAAAMVTKETFDDAKLIFHSETIFKETVADAKHKATVRVDWDPLCNAPDDLYTDRGRERIAGLVEAWLARNHVTCFELLHNADLVGKLEATSTELQHAVQKFAVAEAQIRGSATHQMIRRIQGLLDAATNRLMADHKRGAFPPVDITSFAAAAEALVGNPHAAYLLGGGVAAAVAPAPDWRDKVRRLLDLLDAAPEKGPPRKLALAVLDPLLADIILSKAGLSGLVGECDDLADVLVALTRLISSQAVDVAAAREPDLLKVMPELSPEGQRLAERLTGEELRGVRVAAGRRVLSDLHGHKRLRPGDAVGEVAVLRALALSLTAAADGTLPEEEVAAALSARSRTLLSSDFLEVYLGQGRTGQAEAKALLWLAQTVVGAANKRRAARLMLGSVSSLKFETELTDEAGQAPQRLAALAGLQRDVGRADLVAQDCRAIQDRLGQLGARVEARVGLLGALLKSKAPPLQKLTFLLRLASGEAGPLGPVADRARIEALKMVRDDGLRAELAVDEAQMATLRDLIKDAGLAA